MDHITTVLLEPGTLAANCCCQFWGIPTVVGEMLTETVPIEGRADFLARHAWQIEQKAGIVIHGGRGASVTWNGLV